MKSISFLNFLTIISHFDSRTVYRGKIINHHEKTDEKYKEKREREKNFTDVKIYI